MKILRISTPSQALILLLALLIPLMLVTASFLCKEDVNTFGKENDWHEKIENTKNVLALENNGMYCDAKTGICGPPPGWYTTKQLPEGTKIALK